MPKFTTPIVVLLYVIALFAAPKRDAKPTLSILPALAVDNSPQKDKNKWAIAFIDLYLRFRLEPLKEIAVIPHDIIYKYIPSVATYSSNSETDYYTAAQKIGSAYILLPQFEITKNKSISLYMDILSVQGRTLIASLEKDIPLDQIPQNLDSLLIKMFNEIKCPLSAQSSRYFEISIAGTNYRSLKQLGEILYETVKPDHPSDEKIAIMYEKCIQKDPTLLLAHYPCAQAFKRAGQFDKSAKYLKELLDLTPIHSSLFISLSESCRLSGKINDAYTVSSKFDQMGLVSIPFLYEKAKVLESLKQNSNAFKIYYKILQSNPKHKESLLFCARYYNNDAKYGTSLPFADALIKVDSTDGNAYFERARSLLSLGKTELAYNAIRRSSDLQPNNASFAEFTGDVLAKMNKHADAIEWYKKAFQINSHDINLLLKTSKTLENANKSTEALTLLKSNIANFPDFSLLNKNIGILEASNGNCQASIEFLNSYLNTHPDDIEVLIALGKSYVKNNQFDPALSVLQKAVSLSANKTDCNLLIARIYLYKKDASSAQKQLETVVAQCQVKDAYGLIGDASLMLGNYKDALYNYTKERTLHGNDRFIQEKIANLQYTTGLFTQSSLEFKRLLQIYPDHPQARYYLAIINMKDGNFDIAENYLKEAAAYGKGSSDIFYTLGCEYYQKKKFKKAVDFFEKTLKLTPNHEDAIQKCALSEINLGNDSAGAERYIKLFTINNSKYSNLLAEAGHLFFKHEMTTNAIAAYMLFLSKGFNDPDVNANYAEIEYSNKKYQAVCSLLKNVSASNTTDKKVLLILADARSQIADYNGALGLLNSILTADKDNKQALKLAAIAYEHTNDPIKATSFYEQYLKQTKDREYKTYSFHLGELYESIKMIDKAIDRYEMTRKLYPEDLRNHERLGILYMNKSMWKQAQDVLEGALQSPEAKPLFQKLLAQTYASRNYLEKAIAMYRTYVDKNSNDAAAWKDLGKIYYSRQQYPEAISSLSNAQKFLTNDFESNILLGKAFVESGNYKKAIIPLGHARTQKPNDPSIIELCARCYRNLNETSSLTSLIEEWIALDPKRYDIKVELGSIYLNQHEIDKALSCLNDAVAFLPSESRPHLLLAQVFEFKGNDSLRLDHLNKASKCASPTWELSYQYARYYLSKNKFNEAEKHLRSVLELKPEHAQSHFELAVLLNEKHDNAGALMEMKNAIKYDNHNSLYYSFISYIFSLNDMGNSAMSAIDTAMRSGSNDPAVYYWISQTYRLNNKKDAAFENINKALKINPDFAKGYEALGDLYLELFRFKDASRNYFLSWEKGGYNPARALKLGNALTYNLQYKEAKGFYESILNHGDPSGEAVYRTVYVNCKLGDLKNARKIQKYFQKDDAPWIQLAQGIIYETDNNFESALTAYTIASKISPQNPLIYSGFGRIYSQINQNDTSVVNFQRSLTDSLNMQNLIDLASVFQEKGYVDSALTYYGIVDNRHPEHPSVQIHIASLQSQRNDHKAAIAVLKKGMTYHPNDPMIHFLLGQELERSGTFEEAISEYQVSLKIGKGQPIEALRNIGTIYFQKLINDKKAKEYYKKYVKAGGNKNDIANAMKKLEKI